MRFLITKKSISENLCVERGRVRHLAEILRVLLKAQAEQRAGLPGKD